MTGAALTPAATTLDQLETLFQTCACAGVVPEDTMALQHNLILSHCSGVGDSAIADLARLMMVLTKIARF